MIAPTRRAVRPVVLCLALSVAIVGAGGVLADSPTGQKAAATKADAKDGAKPDAKPDAKPAAPAAASPFLAATRPATRTTDDAVVITNEDLDRLSGGGVYIVTPAVRPGSEDAPAAPAEGEDPLEWMARRQAEAGESAESRATAEQRVAELQKRVADLERRSLAIRNPLLAPPEAPSADETPEGAKPWNELDATQRAERTDAELAAARAELAEARAALGGQ